MTPITFPEIIAVALGGGIGAALRLITIGWASRLVGYEFPWGTFTVNVLGSFVMGVLVGWMTVRWDAPAHIRVFLATGVLGGFTTFSAYSLDFAMMWQDQRYLPALLYAGGSVVFSIAAVFAGLGLARVAFTP